MTHSETATQNKSYRFFKPYKGEFYGTEKSILSKKILIVGASHYCDNFYECGQNCGILAKNPKCAGFTENVIDTYLYVNQQGPWKRTYTAFANSIFGYDASYEERHKFFQSVAFVNYLQKAEGKNGNEKHNSWFRDEQNAEAFKLTIADLTPEIIIVWGIRVWPALPWKDFTIDEVQSTNNAKKCSWQDKSFTLLQVHHPSVGYIREVHLQLFRQNGVFIKSEREG